jgi:hypothetical protein
MFATRALGLGSILFVIGCGGSLSGGGGPLTGTEGQDAGGKCAASGASCAASGCCLDPSDSCLAQGNDRLCVNAIAPTYDGGGAGNCLVGGTFDPPIAAVTFDGAPCSYSMAEIAAGIQIPWHEEVDQTISGLHPTQTDAGRCMQPDDAGLIVTYQISGGGQQYCLCDQGLCAPQSFTTTALAGNYYHAIAWDGRNWFGPSDTGNPEGAPFPPGTYTIVLTTTGTFDSDPGATSGGPFTLTATRTITITP